MTTPVKLKLLPRSTIKAKNITRLVGQVTAGDGIAVALTNGNYVVSINGSTAFNAFITTPSSANLAALLTDELGTGLVVFSSAIRERLSADRVYYVRPNGSDSNTGLANTAGGAFLTFQKAADTIWKNLDTQGHNVTVNIADGTYGAKILLDGPHVGGGTISFVGNTASPGNVLIASSDYGVFLTNGASISISGIKFVVTFTACHIASGSRLSISAYDMGACGQHFQVTEPGTKVLSTGDFTISGSSSTFLHVTQNSEFFQNGGTGTLTGTPAFSAFFFGTGEAGSSTFDTFTFSGAATGQRFFIHEASQVKGVTTPSTFFPGSTTGVLGDSAVCGGQLGSIVSIDTTDATTGGAGAYSTPGGIYAGKDILWGGAAATAYSPTFTSSGGALGSNYTVNSASYKEFGKKTEGRVRVTFSNINTGSGRLIMTLPTTTNAVFSGGGIIRQEISGKSGAGSSNYDAGTTMSYTLADGTFPAIAGGDVLDIWFSYFKD